MTRILVAFDALATSVVARHNPDHPAIAWIDRSDQATSDAFEVVPALASIGYDAAPLPVERDAFAALSRIERERPDLVVNLCDTLRGRSDLAAALPAFCELLDVPVAGASSRGLALSKRKHDVKAALHRLGVPTPRFQVIDHPSRLASFELSIEPPVIVKPTTEHASIGIGQGSLAFEGRRVVERAAWLFANGMGPVLVEEYVDGDEGYVLVAGDPPRAFPIDMYDFESLPAGYPRVRTFDFKWFRDPGLAGEISAFEADPRWKGPLPVRAPSAPRPASMKDLGDVAVEAFLAGGCRDWGRIDLRIDAGGVPLVIDVTPNPYLSSTSACALSAEAGGVSYAEMLRIIVEGALARRRSS